MKVHLWLGRLAQQGGSVELDEGNQLRLRAPQGTLTDEFLKELQEVRQDLVELLQSQGNSGEKEAPHATVRNGPIPLSHAQARLWVMQKALDDGSYNNTTALRLRGPLNENALKRALNAVVARHEILRTSFHEKDGVACQVIAPQVHLIVPTEDIRGYDAAAHSLHLAESFKHEQNRVFDLTIGPLIRLKLYRLADHEYVLMRTVHHIVSDGWSEAVFYEDLTVLYDAFRNGEDDPLPELQLQYADYALWQRRRVNSRGFVEGLSYWVRQLRGAPGRIELPADRPKPSKRTFVGGAYTMSMSQAETVVLKAFSQKHQATLYTTVLACFSVLLARYSGTEDIVIGTPIANRANTELERLIGFFVNVLVMRVNVDERQNFQEILSAVKQMTLDAYRFQEIPFERIVEELRPERHSGGTPLFNVTYAMHNGPRSRISLSDLEVESLQDDEHIARFDLELHTWEVAGQLEFYWQYSKEIFDAWRIEQMARHFMSLLGRLLEAPQDSLDTVGLLDPQDQSLLNAWSVTGSALPTLNIADLFEQQVRRSPSQIAIRTGDLWMTYDELDRRANQLAHHLIGLGVSGEAKVAICIQRSFDMVVGLLAIMKAGAAYVPLDPTYPLDRLCVMLQDSQPRVTLTDSASADLISSLSCTGTVLNVSQSELWSRGSMSAPDRAAIGISSRSAAYVIYTSGSTGTPKGVVVEHQSVVNRLLWMQDGYGVGQHDTILQKTPLTFDVSVWEVFGPLSVGGTVVLATPEGHRDPTYLVQVIRTSKINTVHFVPSMLQVFLDVQDVGQCTSLQHVICSGETLSPALVRRFSETFQAAKLHNLYGPTETTVDSTAWTYSRALQSSSVPIGKPIANTRIYILDGLHRQVPFGVTGEIYIAGVGVARGYLNQPKLSAQRFIPDPFSPDPGARMYRTGDLGTWLLDGTVQFFGRSDSQVKIRGNRVELGEVEAVLSNCEGVQDCVVLLREDVPGDQRLVAYYRASSGIIPIQRLRATAEAKLPTYMVPADYIYVDEFPVTANGKRDRKAYPAPSTARKATDEVAGQIELLCRSFEEVLNVPKVSPEDNFFQLGGHSLLVVVLASNIREKFGIDLRVATIFENPTPNSLLLHIAQSSTAGPGLRKQARLDKVPLSRAQARLWFLNQLAGSESHYNMVSVTRLTGSLDILALKRALDTIVERHEILRTTFGEQNGKPIQIIHSSFPSELPFQDLETFDQEAQQRTLQDAIQRFQEKQFDLASGPLWEFSVLRLSSRQHVFLRGMHHIVSDGWSEDVFHRELTVLYEAYVSGQANPLRELEVQYADYAIWQMSEEASEEAQQGLTWWTQALSGSSKRTNLPVDRPRSERQTFAAGVVASDLSEELTRSLQKLGQKTGATPYMTLLTAFGFLMTRYSGEPKIVIGSPFANRPEKSLEELIGFFVNMLALPLSVEETQTFEDLLLTVRGTVVQAYRYRSVPFERIVEELRPHRTLDTTPLFQVVLEYQNVTQTTVTQNTRPTVSFESIERAPAWVRYDLELHVREHAEHLEMYWQYNRDLFDEWRIQQMSRHLVALLEQVVLNPTKRLDQMSFLSRMERQNLLHEHNDPKPSHTAMPLGVVFESQVAAYPEMPAVLFGDESITYTLLNERANQLAHLLISRGIGTEDVVAVALPRSMDMVVTFLAIAKAGAAYLPLDIEQPQERIQFMLNDAKPVCLLTSSAGPHALSARSDALLIDTLELETDLCRQSRANPANADRVRPTAMGNTAYIIYTSGSTGIPKGVVLTHVGLPSLIQTQRQELGITPGSRVLQFASSAFDACVWELLMALTSGATLILIPETARHNPELQEYIAEHGVTHALIPPPLLVTFTQPRSGFIPNMLVGGEACPPELVDRWSMGRRLINAYGPSECTVCVTLSSPLIPGGGVPLGHPITNVEIYVLDERLEPVPAGVSGEVYLSGPSLARGYVSKAALTAERFVANPFTGTGERMYRTGDLVRRGAGGELEFVGRVDSQIKIRGFRVELGEIENVLRAHSFVEDAVVVTRSSEPAGVAIEAYVIPKSRAMIQAGARLEQWQELYGATYKPDSLDEEHLNFQGWRSSYTGDLIPRGEMLLWADQTASRISALRPAKVLELGCGTGLLVTRLAPQCERYVAIDFSEEAVRRIQLKAATSTGLQHVEAHLGRADDLSWLAGSSFDVVILNSIVQYFPDLSYLLRTLRGAFNLLSESGSMFVGDVRSLPLHRTFQSSVQLAASSPDVQASQARDMLQRALHSEKELLLDPKLFTEIACLWDDVRHTQLLLKGTGYDNELSRYRYDTVLFKGKAGKLADPDTWIDWKEDGSWQTELRQLLPSGCSVGVRSFRDIRTAEDLRALELLEHLPASDYTVGEIIGAARIATESGPENFEELANDLGVPFTWVDLSTPGSYSCVFRPRWETRTSNVCGLEEKDLIQYANVPYQSADGGELESLLMDHLSKHLPSYMLPTEIVALERWPVTPNGKVDRRALRPPVRETTSKDIVSSESEEVLCSLFAQVLELEHVGPTDNFFSLGGHSLMAVSLVSRIRARLKQKVLVDTLFTAPTPRELAAKLRTSKVSSAYGRVIALREKGSLSPLFCFPPAGGVGWVYAGLSGSLDPERPVYCLQASGIAIGEPMLEKVTDIASEFLRYVKDIQPVGPYYFTGWSFGGIVAHEAACELQRRGDKVAFLAVLDTRPVYPRPPQHMQEELENIDMAANAIGERLNKYLQLSSQYIREDWPSSLGDVELHNIITLTKQTTKIMANTNHYSLFQGNMLLFAAEYGQLFQEAWQPYVTGRIETHILHCKHLEVTTAGPLKIVGTGFEDFLRSQESIC